MKPKIVFTRDPLFASLLIRARKMLRFKLVYEAHTLFFKTAKETYMPIAWNEKKEKRIRRREEMVFTSADAIVWISSSLQEFVSRYFQVRNPSVVVHDGTRVPDRIPEQKDPNAICYSGQFYWWKGLSTLIEAMRWVDRAVLRLYGGGYSTVHDDLAIMQKVIDEHQLHSRVEFRGFVQPSKIADAISDCSVGVLPLPKNIIGNHCNSPLKLFDYMANGLAIVSSDLLTVREIITHGRNGHLVEPENARALAGGINQVLSDQSYRATLIDNAFQIVSDYSWNERGRKLLSFVKTIV
jgi:glycosyltransferase involved in cell wall biosynthesis